MSGKRKHSFTLKVGARQFDSSNPLEDWLTNFQTHHGGTINTGYIGQIDTHVTEYSGKTMSADFLLEGMWKVCNEFDDDHMQGQGTVYSKRPFVYINGLRYVIPSSFVGLETQDDLGRVCLLSGTKTASTISVGSCFGWLFQSHIDNRLPTRWSYIEQNDPRELTLQEIDGKVELVFKQSGSKVGFVPTVEYYVEVFKTTAPHIIADVQAIVADYYSYPEDPLLGYMKLLLKHLDVCEELLPPLQTLQRAVAMSRDNVLLCDHCSGVDLGEGLDFSIPLFDKFENLRTFLIDNHPMWQDVLSVQHFQTTRPSTIKHSRLSEFAKWRM